ncbi:hypothetical protein C9J21_10530, partial [Photobacterium phosphoreum]|uniref:Ig-like domain-containing protein n=1 Tax=Photobacterium phosphoreum TaxID=659 RepID=UPI000D434123
NAATANGTDTVTGTIVIQDKQGNVVPDVQVIAKDVTGASISTPAKTDTQGKTTFTFTNVKSGPDTITVSTASDTSGKTQHVRFMDLPLISNLFKITWGIINQTCTQVHSEPIDEYTKNINIISMPVSGPCDRRPQQEIQWSVPSGTKFKNEVLSGNSVFMNINKISCDNGKGINSITISNLEQMRKIQITCL